jgi:phospholipid/cholesterol/gamma-HCH transport system substrate-binding protein
MQKQAPSLGRILVAGGFTLSCFGLILFLWVAFGGPIPLKPESYRVKVDFPEATQLAIESDVRIGGVSVGKVKAIDLAPANRRVEGNDTTEAEIEIQPQFAPLNSDTKAILRQKTLLGETFVELTSGTDPGQQAAPVSLGSAANVSDAETKDVKPLPEGGTLAIGQTQNATQIDEIFNALDPETRRSFQLWQQNAAIAVDGRGLDLNDALGNLGPFVTDASDILGTLRKQKVAVKGLVRDTGTVFGALSERDQQLAGAIRGSDQTFGAIAQSDQALADTVQILPTFQRETRATLERLDQFQANTRPLVRKLLPVANDISPTLRSVRQLSPNLESLFNDLPALITAGKRGLPALSRFLGPQGLRPVLDSLDPFLSNLNPILGLLDYYRTLIPDFLATPGVGLSGSLEDQPGQLAARHYLKQFGYVSPEVLAVYDNRLPTNRGNGYLPRNALGPPAARNGIFPNFDCNNTGGDRLAGDGKSPPVSETFAPCFTAKKFPSRFGGSKFPRLFADP